MPTIVRHDGAKECVWREHSQAALLHTRWGMAPRSRLAGGGCKPPHAARVKSTRGERWGDGTARLCQVRIMETSASEPLMRCRKR